MRHTSALALVLGLAAACFVDAPAEGSDLPASGGATTSGTRGSANEAGPDVGGTTEVSSTGEFADATGTESGDDGCVPGALGCPCSPAGCDDGLSCVFGECSACGDGVVDPPEQCESDVPGGACQQCVLVCEDGLGNCDGNLANGCEMPLVSASNCGACGHGCLGGACEAMVCRAVDLVVGQSQPQRLSVAGDVVFWTVPGSGAGAGEVRSHATAPLGDVAVVATGLSFPGAVVADGSKVYWADTFGNGEVSPGGLGQANYDGTEAVPEWRTSIEMGHTVLLLSGRDHIFALRYDAGPSRAAKVAGATDPVATGFARGGYLDGDMLYWIDDVADEINRADVSGDAPFLVELVVATGESVSNGLFVRAGVVYWTALGSPGGAVRSRPVAGGEIYTYADDLDDPDGIVVDDDYVFWVESNPEGELWRADLDGGNRTALEPAFCASIDQDAVAVYWVDQTGGRIRKLAK